MMLYAFSNMGALNDDKHHSKVRTIALRNSWEGTKPRTTTSNKESVVPANRTRPPAFL